METYPQLIPLIILLPALGAFINFFVGAKMGEKLSGYLGIAMSLLSFVVAVLIFSYLSDVHGAGVVVNPPIFDGWIKIESAGVDIPWQFRVDTMTSVMLLVVTGVGSLIHIYAYGYMHGDPKFSRFFAYLNLFLMFMLILVTANNFVMMFVGWEGVGLCSYLLIGFWWDKKNPLGWKNANAARKAVIVNRIGDFGLVLSMLLIFWTFGTFDYFRPGEVANVPYTLYVNEYISKEQAKKGDIFAVKPVAEGEEKKDEAHSDDAHGHHVTPREELDNSLFLPEQLGVYGQTQYLMSLPVGSPERMIDFGPFTLEFGQVLFLIVIFMLVGVSAKSAQIPLFVWLPDAMAGPTPVSALMHAATMVTAGVFLLIRSNVFLDYAPEASAIIAIIGALTALMGGYVGMGQWDIKRVLAYSTVSQLGFMVAAVGLGAYIPAMFHLVTHALFKACLFLGSGSVIHGVEHGHHHAHHAHGHDDHHGDDHHDAHEEADAFDPQDMRNMGGLWKRMPITFVTYLMATFALAGLFPFAGFWSKDEILLDAWHIGFDKGNPLGYVVLGLLLVAAGFTAFYMWRQVQMVFFGEPRTEAAANAPENSAWMTIPLIVLAFLSLVGGFINVPEGAPLIEPFYKLHEFGHWLETTVPSITLKGYLAFNFPLAALATAVALGAIALAHSIYAGDKAVRGSGEAVQRKDPLEYLPSAKPIWSLANARLYWDEIYFRLFENPFNRVANFLYEVVDWRFLHDYFHDSVIKKGYDGVGRLLAQPVDKGIIDGVVNGVGAVVRLFSGRLRGVQTGYVRTYAVALLLGVVAVVVVMLLPLLQNG
jgi:NADH:ubiquinone oxidoreductase subunit 5 (subunit L)/multisubunit Na+/H+ antiporter MnhA subunit